LLAKGKSRKRRSIDDITADIETTQMMSEDISDDGETMTREVTEARELSIGDAGQIHIRDRPPLLEGETAWKDLVGGQRHQMSEGEIQQIGTETMIDAEDIHLLRSQDLHLQITEKDHLIEDSHIQVGMTEIVEMAEVMGTVDTNTEETKMAMAGETSEDHRQEGRRRKMWMISRLNANAS
jgi:hypothetical protein